MNSMPVNSKPIVSVLTTVYNREKYLAECIESVLASSFQDWEMIIVDDCSSDNSVEVAKKYAAKNPRIKVYVNEKNLGQFENRNYAASLANGKYIKYLDSDDIIYPYGLEAILKFLLQYPEAKIAVSHDQFHENNPYPIFLTPYEAYFAFFFDRGFPSSGPSATLIEKQAFMEIGGFKKPYYVGSDIILLLEIAAKYGILKIPPALNWYRKHDGQALYVGIKSNEYLFNDYFEFKKLLTNKNSPLSKMEILKADKILRRRLSRQFWKLLVKSHDIKNSFVLKRKINLKWSELLLSLK